ncbi:hypothetical protein RFI_39087 [Reticulomyxa filosa]|uniref:Uncharacterized protein n=1 Tax=Reticulomyxa filosa TaxID=46433 RepID=X6LA67_RETFI|nr:hypothetical protein RFI_39087 [Reticulomyxa filosa]|eukprot:ETN98413.1 hypothetical protein RFI_39087 [Reticulomyxa filosa]
MLPFRQQRIKSQWPLLPENKSGRALEANHGSKETIEDIRKSSRGQKKKDCGDHLLLTCYFGQYFIQTGESKYTVNTGSFPLTECVKQLTTNQTVNVLLVYTYSITIEKYFGIWYAFWFGKSEDMDEGVITTTTLINEYVIKKKKKIDKLRMSNQRDSCQIYDSEHASQIIFKRVNDRQYYLNISSISLLLHR